MYCRLLRREGRHAAGEGRLDFPGSDRLFAACLVATVGLPILLWIYIWAYGRFTNKSTIAEFSPENDVSGRKDS